MPTAHPAAINCGAIAGMINFHYNSKDGQQVFLLANQL